MASTIIKSMTNDPKAKRADSSRKHQRMNFFETPWVLGIQMQRDGNQGIHRLEPKNISLGGIKLLSNIKVPLFETIHMELFDKNTKIDSILTKGKVVRVEETDTGQGEKTYGLAVEFVSLDDKSRERMAKILPRS
jgi:hypothetical protein